MRRPPLNTLRLFDAAARHGNFRLASEEVSLTQGAVAQQVRKLEQDIKTSLFNRNPRGLTLTEAGARYHAEIRRALDIIDQATQALHPDTTTVVLSVPPSLASKWLVPRLVHLANDHPEITLDLRASERLTDFSRDRVDLAIRQGRMTAGKGLLAKPLAAQELCAVASPALVDANTIETFSDFSKHRLIEDGHRHWTGFFEEAKLAPPPVSLSFNQSALAIDAALAGQGIALAPRLLVQDALDASQLQELWKITTPDQAYFLVHPDRPQATRDTVVSWLVKQIQGA